MNIRKQSRRPRFSALHVALVLALGLAWPAIAQQNSVAALPDLVRAPNPDLLPDILDRRDEDLYRQIFSLQERGHIMEADRLVDELGDRTLFPFVLAERYESGHYKASKRELQAWLSAHKALPEAAKIAALLKRGSAGVSDARPINEPTYDRNADWLAGLAAWKKNDFARAAKAFSKAAERENANPWDDAAASYWAGRAYANAGQPEKLTPWLRRAASVPSSFYGQLARRRLGMDSGIDWHIPPLSPDQIKELIGETLGRDALALIQVGRVASAERALLALADRDGARWGSVLLSISQAAGMPSLALHIGNDLWLRQRDKVNAAMFPVPAWRPKRGYTVDRALLFAIIRQESGFDPTAKSPAGARGLMQLMPATARHVAGAKANLADPIVSMGLGQDYIRELMSDDAVGNDLVRLAISYNAGPNNLKKWLAGSGAQEDPLLFIETLPSRQTRLFVARVLTNYWMYRDRLGEVTQSLDELAGGGWAPYGRDRVVTENTAER
ncbi:MAG TPA: transglycosylase SLT domain-containing protein [Dongiaceae bacterium]|jgi:soluble lytic murein transglycosylase-like protein|nr:transglycosylase SLT domain-containing protein [Dongiaceae bacterium]